MASRYEDEVHFLGLWLGVQRDIEDLTGIAPIERDEYIEGCGGDPLNDSRGGVRDEGELTGESDQTPEDYRAASDEEDDASESVAASLPASHYGPAAELSVVLGVPLRVLSRSIESGAADAQCLPAAVGQLVDEYVGSAFGRWDIRFAAGEKPATDLPDPFAPLPVYPPGQLQNERGLPMTKEDVGRAAEIGRWDYRIDIPWDGILVDDPGHPLDVEARVQRVLQVIWRDRWEAVEGEACEILGVRTLRDHFRKPAGFFADHLKRYSKSRRKAAIYWELATPSHSYAVWLYYHRLSHDTFYKVLHEYVAPKLHHEERKLTALRQEFGPNPAASQRKQVAEQDGSVEDLRGFRDEVGRIAPLWNPDLNDGVIINFAPLWRLVPQHRAWQKECKGCWDKLVNGDYDWAHLAMHLWPERVVPECRKDASLAIAHGLAETFWEQDDKGKWVSKPEPEGGWESVIEQLVSDRTKPAVKAALNNLLSAPVPAGTTKGRRADRGRRSKRG